MNIDVPIYDIPEEAFTRLLHILSRNKVEAYELTGGDERNVLIFKDAAFRASEVRCDEDDEEGQEMLKDAGVDYR
ncbi:MAG TPA: hypothetical protein VGC76_14580 [Pyrinomonadaceae bacterium]|jgi:hypothetical protein